MGLTGVRRDGMFTGHLSIVLMIGGTLVQLQPRTRKGEAHGWRKETN